MADRMSLLLAAMLVSSAAAIETGNRKVIRCFWGKCSVIHGPWKKCVPNEQCDGSELRCERQCILEHTGCPPKHTPGSCHKDLFAWKCSTQHTCPQGRRSARCHKTCLPRDARRRYGHHNSFLSHIPFISEFFQ
ncbi:uncharacterized protein LOC119388904 [Rhipicephalus sanguineus]|uniref:uncharacterized protein LOC119388904 n=1 Tax=Rhipicephalus sanguineus TaxID=34632 RepID=UPI001893855F|nr:uncharacterized protein LOC119388904 [Rhipicephalus sanguineus]XP_037512196.1 uncharacterized protein LOC119388904 [Rhipicephalus sanguineus]